MPKKREHPCLGKLKEAFAAGRVGRREFLRLATLLGLSAGSAYAIAGVTPRRARAATGGGILRIGSRIKPIKDPHTYSWGMWDSNISRQVVEYLTITRPDNITYPYLCQRWEVSDDLKTWTLHLRRDVRWHDGRPFGADDVVWNLNRVLDPETGSSVLGLMKAYMLEEYETGGVAADGTPETSVRLWDANAIEKADDHTVRLNCKTPQIAVPEHLFHYPLPILDPAEDGVFGVGSNGTGAFDLVEFDVGKKAVLEARSDYWGDGPHVDRIEFLDLGDDPSASIGALASRQIHGLVLADPVQYEALKGIAHTKLYQTPTAETAVMRVKVTKPPFDDPRVRKALRLGVDPRTIYKVALRGLGTPGEHHHVSPIHPEYAKLPFMERDPAAARRLLAEAGHPDGLDVEIAVPKDPPWEPLMVQAAVEQWKEAGIRVAINLMPGAQFWEIWDKVPFGCTTWYHRPLGIMVLGLAYRTGVPWNETEYANPEFDRLLTQAEGTLDVEARREIMRRLETIMQEDGPIVQPLWRNNFTFFDKKVKGFQMHPTGYVFGNELSLEA